MLLSLQSKSLTYFALREVLCCKDSQFSAIGSHFTAYFNIYYTNSAIMLNLERTIKDLLRNLGKTQKEMCAAIGFSYGALRNSYDRNSMEVSVLEKIADYLGVPMAKLLGEGMGDNCMNKNSLNTINDGEAINRLVGIIEEKDRQISRLLDLLDGQRKSP